jgi:hypothetical protein
MTDGQDQHGSSTGLPFTRIRRPDLDIGRSYQTYDDSLMKGKMHRDEVASGLISDAGTKITHG